MAGEGCALARDVLAFILMLFDPDAPPVSEWLPRAVPNLESSEEEGGSECSGASPPNLTNTRGWVLALHARARGADGERGVNVAALASWALGSPLVQAAEEDTLCLWTRLAAEAAPTFGSALGEGRDLLDRVRAYTRVGAAFPHKKGCGFNIEITEGISVSGQLVALPPRPRQTALSPLI